MTGTEIMRGILERESLSPTRVSTQMGHGKAYVNTLIAEGKGCKVSTLVEFCDTTGYELIVRSNDDGYEFEVTG